MSPVGAALVALIPAAAISALGTCLPQPGAIAIGAGFAAPGTAAAAWVAHRALAGSTVQTFIGLLGALLLRAFGMGCSIGGLFLLTEGSAPRVWGMAAAGLTIAAGLALDAGLLHAKVRCSPGKPPQ